VARCSARAAAATCFRAGIEAAQEANDRALGAYLVGSSCVQPAYRERPQARLRRLQGQTVGFQTFDANPSTRAWLITLEAEAHALAGNERAALIALDAADTAMAPAAEEDNSRRPGLMAALATAHVRQGNIDQACRLGSEALDLAARQQVAPTLQDVRRLRLELEPWRDPSGQGAWTNSLLLPGRSRPLRIHRGP
jgi:hypothetical protein